MKIRSGFVSNSSSCSFLVFLDDIPNTEVNMEEYCDQHGSAHKRDLEISKNLKTIGDNIDKIPAELKEAVVSVMKETTMNNIHLGYVDKNGKYLENDEWTPEMVCKELQKEYEAGKGKEFHMEVDKDGDNLPMGSKDWNVPEEQLIPFKEWKEDLKNPRGYFREAVKDYIRWGLERTKVKLPIHYGEMFEPFDLWWDKEEQSKEFKETFDKMINLITDYYIDFVLKEYDDYQVYFVHYVTDGESKNPFRYIAESTEPFKNFPLFIKYNSH